MFSSDRRLVDRCLAGDRSAFEELYDRHVGRVYSLLRRLSGEPPVSLECAVANARVLLWKDHSDGSETNALRAVRWAEEAARKGRHGSERTKMLRQNLVLAYADLARLYEKSGRRAQAAKTYRSLLEEAERPPRIQLEPLITRATDYVRQHEASGK
jgi:hypothetical protein